MPSTIIKGDRVPIRVWAPAHEVDTLALRQLKAVASLPWVAHHVAVMPDVHVGKGATVGSVIALRGAVAPAAVGGDIGCGMAAVKTSVTGEDLPDDLKRVRLAIEAAVPLSFESASHGAGRRLSRTQARSSITLADLERQTEGVECRKDRGVIDEAPRAYKNIERVMAQQDDLVEIVHELKHVVCVKG